MTKMFSGNPAPKKLSGLACTNHRFVLLVLIGFGLLSCGPDVQDFLQENPEFNAELFPLNWETPWQKRVYPLQGVAATNLKQGFHDLGMYARPYYASDAIRQKIEHDLNFAVPSYLSGFMDRHFAGIYLFFGNRVDGFAAITSHLLHPDGQPRFAIFVNAGRYEEGISSPGVDTLSPVVGWSYAWTIPQEFLMPAVLNHELGHALDQIFGITGTPTLMEGMDIPDNPIRKVFTKAVWQDEKTPQPEYPIIGQPSWSTMEEDKVPISQLPDIYQSLVDSPFISHYGTTNMREDWAEYWMNYHLIRVWKIPFSEVITSPENRWEFRLHQGVLQQSRLDQVQKFAQWLEEKNS